AEVGDGDTDVNAIQDSTLVSNGEEEEGEGEESTETNRATSILENLARSIGGGIYGGISGERINPQIPRSQAPRIDGELRTQEARPSSGQLPRIAAQPVSQFVRDRRPYYNGPAYGRPGGTNQNNGGQR
ncbi:MAG: hypothetical protein AAGA67_03595, partial [Cyanobacteria bacterium P01_F01_bin.153]